VTLVRCDQFDIGCLHMDEGRLSEIDVAERAGTTLERIRELTRLGVLEGDSTGGYAPTNVMRARIVEDLDAKGIAVQALSEALASGHLTLGYLHEAGERGPRAGITLSDLASELNVPVETVQMMYVAGGLPRPPAEEFVREEDLPMLRGAPVMFGAGVSEGDVLHALRVWGESARRVAQFHVHYFHAAIEEPFRRRGLKDNDALEAAIQEVGLRLGHSGEEMLGWLYRRHAEVFLTEHLFDHVEAALEEAGVRHRAPDEPEAAVFADLTGYTRFTEEAGDRAAAAVSVALGQLVNEIAVGHHGEVVKMLGDGVHFHFRAPIDAVKASLDIVAAVRPHGLPPAHVGVNAGPMIYDEGDYFGRTVNIAARIASQAGPDQVFLGEDVVPTIEPDGFTIKPIGASELKGISRPVMLYEAVRGPGSDA